MDFNCGFVYLGYVWMGLNMCVANECQMICLFCSNASAETLFALLGVGVSVCVCVTFTWMCVGGYNV